MGDAAERDAQGRWRPGKSANPATQWGPDNPPPTSPGRPRRDAWLAELEERLEDPRIRRALADRLLKVALKGSEKASLAAIAMVQDRVGGPVIQRVSAEMDVNCGVLVAPASVSPEDWIAAAAARNATLKEPGVEGEDGT